MGLSPVSIRSRGRLAAVALAATLAIAACGGNSNSADDGGQAVEPLPEVYGAESSSPDSPATRAATGVGFVDLVGPDVMPAAEIDTNVLPSVVVEDLNNGRKVNFRNLVPQSKPVLLWMWAPH